MSKLVKGFDRLAADDWALAGGKGSRFFRSKKSLDGTMPSRLFDLAYYAGQPRGLDADLLNDRLRKVALASNQKSCYNVVQTVYYSLHP